MMADNQWAGAPGDEYVLRQIPPDRSDFWNYFYRRFPVNSVLEVGCGQGFNLRYAQAEHIFGMDVNESALARAAQIPGVMLMRESLLHQALPDGFAELVFSCGVLIHIEPERIERAMDELIRLSSRYVLVMEYFAFEETEVVPYRPPLRLWKRPYQRLMSERIGDRPLRSGYLAVMDGFDDVTWSVWEKK